MKKGLMLLMVAALSLSIASCGNKNDENNSGSETASPAVTDNNTSSDSSPAPTIVAGTAIEGAGDEVDMKKVEGEKLDETEPEDTQLSSSDKIGNFEVSIEDAKVIDYENNKVLIVSIKFKNGNSTPMSFSGIMSVDTTQGGSPLRPTVVTNIEGVNINSIMEEIDSGKTTTVQKAYVLNDESSDVNVLVYKYGEPYGDSVAKSFKLK